MYKCLASYIIRRNRRLHCARYLITVSLNRRGAFEFLPAPRSRRTSDKRGSTNKLSVGFISLPRDYGISEVWLYVRVLHPNVLRKDLSICLPTWLMTICSETNLLFHEVVMYKVDMSNGAHTDSEVLI